MYSEGIVGMIEYDCVCLISDQNVNPLYRSSLVEEILKSDDKYFFCINFKDCGEIINNKIYLDLDKIYKRAEIAINKSDYKDQKINLNDVYYFIRMEIDKDILSIYYPEKYFDYIKSKLYVKKINYKEYIIKKMLE